jgi:hypothetical protein
MASLGKNSLIRRKQSSAFSCMKKALDCLTKLALSLTFTEAVKFASVWRSVRGQKVAAKNTVPPFCTAKMLRREHRSRTLGIKALAPFYRKSRLKAHGFNHGMKGGVARHPLLGMVRATNLLYNRTYERCSSHW